MPSPGNGIRQRLCIGSPDLEKKDFARFGYKYSIIVLRLLLLRGREKMRIKVKLYAAVRDIVGSKEENLEFRDGTTVGMVLDDYIRRFPQIGRYREHLILSVNKEYGAHGRMLKDGDEVTFLPPVSGG